MTSASTRRIRFAAAGLCAAGSLSRSCDAFSCGPRSAGVLRQRPPTSLGASGTGARSGRAEMLPSMVGIEPSRSTAVGERTWRQPEPRRLLEPEMIQLDTLRAKPVATKSEFGEGATAAGVDVVATEQPRRTKRRGKEPEVLEGDHLAVTPKMLALVYSSLGLNALYLCQAVSTIASPWQAVWTVVGALLGYVIADMVSGVFHWSVDNYGDANTPVFGMVIEAFQGHHASPWTITHRPFANNVHKICYAVLPLLALLRLVNPGPGGVAFGVTFLVGSLMSQEFHRYAHMVDPPPLARKLQDVGFLLSRKQHGRHHSSPFEDTYSIVSGWVNGPLDHFRVFRFVERVIYHLNGVEPISWGLDPSLKEEAMATGWLPFTNLTQENGVTTP